MSKSSDKQNEQRQDLVFESTMSAADDSDQTDLLASAADWREQIRIMRLQPEYADEPFFPLLESIIDDAEQGRRTQDLCNRCVTAARQAQSFYKRTGVPQFAEWGIGLVDYARTWTDDYDISLFANPLFRAEEDFWIQKAAEGGNPITKLKGVLASVNESLQLMSPADTESIKTTLELMQSIEPVIEKVKTFMDEQGETAAAQNIRSLIAETEEMLAQTASDLSAMIRFNTDKVYSLLQQEIKKTKYKGLSLEEIRQQSTDENGHIKEGSLYRQACDAVSKALSKEAGGKADLPAYRTATADTYYALNNKVSNTYMALQDIFTSIQPDGQFTWRPMTNDMQPIRVRNAIKNEKNGKIVKNEVVSSVALTYTGDLDGKLAKINKYDQSVLNAVCSLWMAENTFMTVEDIYYFLTRKNRRTTRPTEKQKQRIELTLLKYSGMRIKMDVSNEIREGILIADGDRITPLIDDTMLNFRIYSLRNETSGKEVSVYEIKEAPFLLHYSQSMKNPQIVSYPAEWLDLKGINATEDVVVLRDYLLKEIKQMQGGHRDNRTINYDTLLSLLEADPDALNRKERGRYTEKICRILDAIKEKHIISGYKQRNGRHNKVLGFEIEL